MKLGGAGIGSDGSGNAAARLAQAEKTDLDPGPRGGLEQGSERLKNLLAMKLGGAGIGSAGSGKAAARLAQAEKTDLDPGPRGGLEQGSERLKNLLAMKLGGAGIGSAAAGRRPRAWRKRKRRIWILVREAGLNKRVSG